MGAGLFALVLALAGGTRGTQDAVANGDTRSLALYHTHTRESATITFRRNGQYDRRGLEQLNWMLRDWRRDEPTEMDPRLFDTLWEVYRMAGAEEPIHIASAYRSPATNAMLRRRSSAVAKNSQHMRGKAMDFYLPDVPIDRIRAIAMRMQHGGVGYYPSAYNPFIHLDVGSVRAWPRMTRDQLVRLFPDGKTVHIPTDGNPLPGYEQAKAEVIAEGWSVAGYSAVASAEETSPAPRRRSFWAALFGFGADEDEDADEIRSARTRQVYVARRAPPPNIYGDQNSSVYVAFQPPVQQEQVRAPLVRPAPQPDAPDEPKPAPTRIAGLPRTVDTPSGPKLAFQQGSETDSPGLDDLALAPLPPKRPEDVAVTGALAFAPMPPSRPGSLATGYPLPDVRATLVAAAPDHPLPPPRPGAGARTIALASAGAVTLPPVALPPVAAPAQNPRLDDKARLSALISDAAKPSPPPAAPNARPSAAASNAVLAGSPGLNLGFSSRPTGDLSAARFSGPAVKPLPVLR